LIADFFHSIADDPSSIYFRPHPLTKEFANSLCDSATKDYYVLLLDMPMQICGYAMLRGWDEGWLTPSLGIYISPHSRSSGASSLLMDHLHHEARERGATTVRLKVDKKNHKAIALYQRMNYVFISNEGENLIGNLNLQ
jgi:ribosomal protein S18 acetylase RimI-like enzyme